MLASVVSGTAYSCDDVFWDTADFNRDGEVNADDVAAFTFAMSGQYRVPAGDIGEYRFLYRGYWCDQHLNIYHVRHRAYDPRIQRWLQPDPAMFVDGLNRYAYCGNRPFSLYDPMGLFWSDVWDGAVSVVQLDPGGARTRWQSYEERERQRRQFATTDWANPLSDASLDAEERITNAGRVRHFNATAADIGASHELGMRLVFPAGDAADGIATAVGHVIDEPNGRNLAVLPLLVAIEVLPGKSPAGSHWLLRKEARATGDQANHLLQHAVFGDVIDRDVGISVWLNGNAHDVGSEHYKFHKLLDDFLEPFMPNRPKHGTRPTVKQYLLKMTEALRATGRYTEEDIGRIVRSAEKQIDDHGLKLGDDIPRVPGGRATPKCSSGS